jgi:hypothetical protein
MSKWFKRALVVLFLVWASIVTYTQWELIRAVRNHDIILYYHELELEQMHGVQQDRADAH